MIEIPCPEKVEEESLTPTPDIIPNDHSDWADMHSNTILSLRDEFIFDVGGIAFLDETYDYDFYVGASVSFAKVRRLQDSVDWLGHKFEADTNGIDEQSDGKYSLKSRITALARTVLTDGYTHALNMVDSSDEIRIEYAENRDRERYVIQIFWKS